MDFVWITPNKDCKNISVTIEKIYMGLKKEEFDDDENNYTIDTPILSESIYREIVQNISMKNNNNNNDNNKSFQFLKFNKQTNTLKKVDKKNLLRFSKTICPLCHYSNCVDCTKTKFRNYMKRYNNIFLNSKSNKKKSFITTTTTTFPRYIKCYNCQNIFLTIRKYKLFNCIGYECSTCEKKYSQMYNEFVKYNDIISNKLTTYPLRNLLNIHYGDDDYSIIKSRKKKIQYIYESFFTENVKKELRYNYQTLYYHLKVKKKDNGEIILIPPLAFFVDMNKPSSFYLKLLDNNDPLNVKSQYGSVNSRAQGGKNSIFRNTCLNKRYLGSARLVIVPRQSLLPHECILPKKVYEDLNCPKHVLCHRYPTLDIRSLTYHRVVGFWSYPSLAISTAIVSGNNADFDGDCLHVIPVTNIVSQAEIIFLCHPMWNMVVGQNQLRINFDHDEIETIYSQFGLTRHQIHDFIYNIAKTKNNLFAYQIFCYLKRYCEWVWTFQGSVSSISFRDFLEIIITEEEEYDKFINHIFPERISPNNGIKKLIDSQASRFSINHVWQMFGYINEEAKDRGGFLKGMSKSNFIQMARLSRLAMIKDIAYHGYSQIKLTHCTKSIVTGYDQRLYTTDDLLVAMDVADLF